MSDAWLFLVEFSRAAAALDPRLMLPLLAAAITASVAASVAFYVFRTNRAEKTSDSVRAVYDIVPSDVSRLPMTPSIKEEFFFGQHRRPYWDYLALGLACPRDLAQKVFERIRVIDHHRFAPRIEIVGDRKQGKTILLASLAFTLARSRRNVVLWCKTGSMQGNATDYELLKRFQDWVVNPPPRLFRRARRLIVFIDDVWSWNVTSPAGHSVIRFLQDLRPRGPLVIVSTSEQLLGHALDPLEPLTLSTDEARTILTRLADEPPPLLDRAFADRFPALVGGERMYRGDLAAFMSFLLGEASDLRLGFARELHDLLSTLSPDDRGLLKWVAVSQLLDCALPESIARRRYPAYVHHDIEIRFQGWLRREALPDGSHELSMGAPYLATWVLRKLDPATTDVALLDVYAAIVTAIDPDGVRTAAEAEFARTLLYRLSRNRFFRLPRVDSRGLARALFEKCRPTVEALAAAREDPRSSCMWAVTLARLNQRQVAMALCDRVLSGRHGSGLDLDAFVALTTCLRLIDKPALTLRACRQLDLAGELRRDHPISRKQQAIDSYLDLVQLLGDAEKCLSILRSLPAEIGSDPLMILRRGVAHENLGDLSGALIDYQDAVKAARVVGERNPTLLQHCLVRFGTFLSRNPSIGAFASLESDPESYFVEAAGLAINLDRSYDDVMHYWGQHREQLRPRDVRGAQDLYSRGVTWADERGWLSARCCIALGTLLARAGDQTRKMSRAESCATAEGLYRRVIGNLNADWRSRCRAYQQLGRLVGGSRYMSRDGRRRPDKAEAVELLALGFESQALDRNDDRLKGMEDLRAHRSLGELYARWADEEDSRRDEMLRLSEFHLARSFTGLPRDDFKGARVLLVVRNNRAAYERRFATPST